MTEQADMILVPRDLLASACHCVRKHAGVSSETYRQLSVLSLAPAHQQADLAGDIGFCEDFGRNWLDGSVAAKTVLLAYLRSSRRLAHQPASDVREATARAYFERGFIAAAAWHMTKKPDARLSDDVIDHAWAHRDEGMDPEDMLPALRDPAPDAVREAEKRGERRAIARLVQVAADIAFHAGVGGRETAGALASYLATKPDEIEPFVAGKLSIIDMGDEWIKGGCLSWHSVSGDIVWPEALPVAPAAVDDAPLAGPTS